MLKGFDVSHWQNDRGPIDWRKLADQGYTFAMIKLTEGQNFIDPEHAKNIAGAKAAGLMVGGYHFARFQTALAAKEEADHFRSVAKHFDLDYVILDIEHPEAAGDLTYEASVFMDAIADLGKPLLYSYPAWIRSHFSDEITKYPLWIAHYGVKEPDIHPWQEWQVWQHSSSAHIDGLAGDVDVNYMQESFAVAKHVDAPKTKVEAVHITKDTDTYRIEPGDTLWDLENKWGLHHGTLERLNPQVNPKRLNVGQKIHVPAAVRPAPKTEHHISGTYTVQSGETLSGIGSKLGIDWRKIAEENGIHAPYTIYPGQVLKLRVSHHVQYEIYKVEKGDFLSTIGSKLGVDWHDLAKWNDLKPPYTIYPGQQLKYQK